jgi:DNA-binding CsgD family transcriptional regulator
MLLGRESECERIERLVARARDGESGVLVLRGEPGIGKTALLEHAAASAGVATVLRVRGVETEVEVAFAGLHELLRPVLDQRGRLPAPQRAALEGALGLAPVAAAEPQLVGAATLGLLAALAEERPVLVLADDVHWLDGPSASALTFAARRLLADAVAVLLTVRAGESSPIDAAGLEELAVPGLAAEPARALIEAHATRPVAGDTAGWLHAATGGNPLALVELAAEAPRLRPGPVGDHVPIGDRIARALGRRLDRLSEDALRALLTAAVADGEEIEPVLGAARALGGSLAGLEEAEAAGLVGLGAGRVAFRHPLVRSVALARATPADRRAAHRAYADALATEADAAAERRAWHIAAGTLEPDEDVAAALAAAAASAGGRGGYAAAAAAFAQAAALSPEPARRAERLRRAADAAWLAGDGPRALALLDSAARLPADAAERAQAGHLRGRVLARRGPIALAVAALGDAAEAMAEARPPQAAEAQAEAAYTALHGRHAAEETLRTAERAVELAPDDDPRARCLAAIAMGAALVLNGRAEGADWLADAAALIEATPALRDELRLAALLGVPPTFLRVPSEGYAPLRRAVALARERGAAGILPYTLFYVGMGAFGSPRWAEAAAHFEEGARLGAETGLRVDAVCCLAGLARVEARRGDAAAAAHAAAALAGARELGMPWFEAAALHAQADLALGAGDLPAAVAAFEEKLRILEEDGTRDPDLSPLPELVELLMRIGREEEAAALAARYAGEAEAKGRAWGLARARRAEALVAVGDAEAEARFAEALELLAGEEDVFERARCELCLGERRRRVGRRVDARAPLRSALATFDALGADPWAERAGAELKATGETVRRRDASSLDELTPQELRIALMLAEGATTRQAAAALYLSPKTVEYHLRHVYLKLGVNSRAALAQALRAGGGTGPESNQAPTRALRARG